MKVEVWLQDASRPVEFKHATSTYVKGPLFCVRTEDKVHKFPIRHIFRVVEDYK